MKLDQLYSLRTDFTIIGLTGRTGSGCSKIAEILSDDFHGQLSTGLRNSDELDDLVFRRKYEICKDFLSYGNNWQPFTVIKYTKVLVFYILYKYGGDLPKTKQLFLDNFKEEKADENNKEVERIIVQIAAIDRKFNVIINAIKTLPAFENLKADSDLINLESLFFGNDFNKLCSEFFDLLDKYGPAKRKNFLHWVSCNIRSTGDPLGLSPIDIKNIFSIAHLINRLIKAKSVVNKKNDKSTKIVIDSLRNSLEIMFFKERYSAFYMLATKDVIGNTKRRLDIRLQRKVDNALTRKTIIEKFLELDEIEYRTKDFANGKFSSPDVENCIQKSDYHIFNLKKEQLQQFVDELFEGQVNGFYTREEQLMKLIALIQQPGLITPSSAERAMQIANTSKLNSGCISRKVGAVVTDAEYFVKSVGWNDVAKGHTPCNLRSVNDFLIDIDLSNSPHYSKFEKGDATDTSSYKYKGSKPGNFKEALIDYFKEPHDTNKKDLNGKNCSFCFKTVHNFYEGEANQVHTRSLHAEENAMMQITKLGGTGAKGGFLFTTASPCELCSKKAYQLGITKIYFIDPYPGIAVDQILKGGMKANQPKLIPFSGAIGNAYHELYESFMSYKDEIAMTLELKPKQKISKEIKNVLNNIPDNEVRNFLKETNLNDSEVIELVKSAIQSYKEKK